MFTHLLFSGPSHLFMHRAPNIRITLQGFFFFFCISLHFLYRTYVLVWVGGLPLYYALQSEVAQAVSKAFLSQLHISAAGDTGKHHHQGWALLTTSPWIRPVARRSRHGWWRRMGTSNQEGKPVMSRGRQKTTGEDFSIQRKYCILIREIKGEGFNPHETYSRHPPSLPAHQITLIWRGNPNLPAERGR